MGDNGIGLCNWCGESFIIRYGCECKKLASNQEWLDKAGLVKNHKNSYQHDCLECQNHYLQSGHLSPFVMKGDI